jgi:methyltransferase
LTFASFANLPAPPWVPVTILALVALQRLTELLVSGRNTRRLMARGGFEVAAGHYPLVVGFHVLWLVTLALWVMDRPATINPICLGAYALLQGARLWTMLALGPYWTTRIITVPDAPLVRRGPYRFLRHPNYLIVALEVALLPLAFGAWVLALGFSAAHAAVLAVRIRAENAALAQRS